MHEPLVELGKYLKSVQYNFTTVTPDTHARNLTKGLNASSPLRNLFGWSREVERAQIPEVVLDCLTGANMLSGDDVVRSRVRFATVDDMMFMHSAFPTEERNSVFFGPDSYRFVQFVLRKLQPGSRVVDVGCGSGVGGISLVASRKEIWLSDINPRALEFAKINAAINGVAVTTFESPFLNEVPPGADTVISNPPFIMDSTARSYRDGGGCFGSELSVMIVEKALDYLPKNGQLLLYSATCFSDGVDVLRRELQPLLSRPGLAHTYEEIDPDIFGEELSQPAYHSIERLAAVGLCVQKN